MFEISYLSSVPTDLPIVSMAPQHGKATQVLDGLRSMAYRNKRETIERGRGREDVFDAEMASRRDDVGWITKVQDGVWGWLE
ncbi:hypothetical protein ONZ45_g16663 [Pleurotus djamor]|nr:hypothetical protein ONZ45_g16663 [Pleurotus djamor]